MRLSCLLFRRWRTQDALFFIGFALLVAVFAVPNQDALFRSLDRLYFELLASQQAEDNQHDVVLVNIDQATLDALGQKGVRANASYAALLEQLRQADSVVLGLNLTANRHLQQLLDAIKRHGRVVVAAPAYVGGDAPARIAAAAAGVGQRELLIGDGNVATGILPYAPRGKALLPNIVLEALRVADYELPARQVWCLAALWQRCSPQEDGWLLVLPAQHRLQQYSMLAVLNGAVPPSAFENKIVVVGHLAMDPFKSLRASHKPMAAEGYTRSQIIALQIQTLMEYGPVSMVAAPYKLLINLAIMLGLLLVCLLSPPARMHGRAWLWLGTCLLASILLLLYAHTWVPVSSPLIGGLLIYAGCAWRWQAKTHALLRQESASMQLSLREAGMALPLRGGVETGADEIERLMRQMRAWQDSYASVLNLLPYPIFFEQDGKIVLSNQAGRKLLGEHGEQRRAEDWMLALTAGARAKAQRSGGISIEQVRAGPGEHMLLVTPCPELCAGRASNLISLVDLPSVKETASSDRHALRQMVHDLRNPLTAILLLIEQRGGGDGPRQDQFLDELRRQVHYSLRVAQDFMQLSRAEHLNPAHFLPVSLRDLAEEAVDQIRAGAGQQRIAVHGPDAAEPLWVNGHYDMLLRAVVNVLDNAIKYSPPGSEVTVRLACWGELAGICVIDQGIGIPEHALPRLFELFYQVDEQRRDGVGLGLPFVKAVLQAHGGRVEVKSRSGMGSEFQLQAPRLRHPACLQQDEEDEEGAFPGAV